MTELLMVMTEFAPPELVVCCDTVTSPDCGDLPEMGNWTTRDGAMGISEGLCPQREMAPPGEMTRPRPIQSALLRKTRSCQRRGISLPCEQHDSEQWCCRRDAAEWRGVAFGVTTALNV